jgi:hypothetical protein
MSHPAVVTLMIPFTASSPTLVTTYPILVVLILVSFQFNLRSYVHITKAFSTIFYYQTFY